MDCFPELKDIIMDNAPIHTADQIDEMIVARWYKSIYLPPYSPELNPIEQFWAIVKIRSNVVHSNLPKICLLRLLKPLLVVENDGVSILVSQNFIKLKLFLISIALIAYF